MFRQLVKLIIHYGTAQKRNYYDDKKKLNFTSSRITDIRIKIFPIFEIPRTINPRRIYFPRKFPFALCANVGQTLLARFRFRFQIRCETVSEDEERIRPIIRRERGLSTMTLATTRRHLETRRLYGAVMRMDNLTFANRG